MSHNEGLNPIETARAYVEQQREMAAAYVLLFGRWCDLAAQKRKETRRKYLLISSKNKLLHLQVYVMLSIVLVCEIFPFDAVFYFLCNLII
jgi:hypothetical protein